MTVNVPFVNGVAESGTNAIEDGFIATPDGGIISGVTPSARPAGSVTPPPAAAPPAPSADPNVKLFTEEEVARIRKEEKDKLYADLQEVKTSLKETEKREKERIKAEEEARLTLEAEAKAKAEAEMELKDLLETRTNEWNSRFEEERNLREQLAATLEMERRFTEVSAYKTSRIDQERDNILPELINLIAGNTPEEIEASIASLRGTTESILGNIQQAQMVARQSMPGTSITAPPVGPQETQTSTQTLSAEEIRAMNNDEYAKHRDRLLGAVRQNVGQKGIYG